MFTTQGGVEIEQVAANEPGRARPPARRRARGLPAVDRAPARLRRPASRTRPSRSRSPTSSRSSTAASSSATRCSCEINPLIVTPDGEVKALDSKFTVDDSALYRHPDIAEFRDTSAADPLEAFAREKGVTYVKLDGSVGILGNGAGLSMSTVDVVVVAGGKPANFCDLGGGGNARGRRRRARGDHARPAGAGRSSSTSSAGSRAATRSRAASSRRSSGCRSTLPIVVRLDGTNAEEGRQILADAAPPNLYVEPTMLDAAKKAVELAA